jgi:hypothetical protein
MTRLLRITPIVFVAVLASAPPVIAQPATFQGRGFILVNGGYQITGNDFEKVSSLRANVEDGSFTTDYDVKGGPAFDVGGGVALSRRFAVGVGLTRFSRSTSSALSGSVPHPFFFNRPRTVTGDVVGLNRDELAVHVQAQAIVPVGSRLQLVAFGGPSFFRVDQELVTNFTWVDSYPFDDATFGAATTISANGSSVGFNAGVDVAYFFTQRVGIGGMLQFSRATVELDDSQQVKAGGTKAGGGLRLRF